MERINKSVSLTKRYEYASLSTSR